jgi:excinuclease ABC subunit C
MLNYNCEDVVIFLKKMGKLLKKVNKLPFLPGVYIFKNKAGHILYIGKAARLKNRVRSYFKKPLPDPRLYRLVDQIAKINHLLCDSEIEALILESELIKRYKPKYNVEWKDDKNFLYIGITKEEFPRIFEIRPPLPENTRFFGPFTDASAVRNTLKTLRKIFPYHTCPKLPNKACLQYFIKGCPAPCIGAISKNEYKRMVKNLIDVLSGKKNKVMKQMEKEMGEKSAKHEYEKAALLRDRIFNLKKIRQTVIFDEASGQRLKADEALNSLFKVLRLTKLPRRIEAYDVSNIAGKQACGSMIVFQDGLPKKKEYKRFKIRTVKGIDDYKMMKEILTRRLKQSWPASHREELASRGWLLPDLIIIDGGKGQLSVGIEVLRKSGLEKSISVIGLAKKKEEIIIKKEREFEIVNLPKSSKVLHLLQRIRDEAHRFAISYHEKLRSTEIKKSILDEISGIGPKTRKLLIKKFGSVKNIKKESLSNLAGIVGEKKAKLLKKYL